MAFADDLAVIITGKSKEEVEALAEQGFQIIKRKMERFGLELAPEKTEAVLLNTRMNTPTVQIRIGNTVLESKNSSKYLGIWLETGMKTY